MKEAFSKESSPKESMRQEVKELFDAAGLNEFDTKIIRDFREYGFCGFVHGSLVKSELRDVSDIDFALVGDFSKIPFSIREKFIPKITDAQLNSIDYFSIENVSTAGRRISLHIEKSEFREQYPNNQRPYAREYRPTSNVKISQISNYLFCGFDSEGVLYIFSVACPQEELGHGVINTIPQTGIFLFEQEIATPENNPSVSIPIKPNISNLDLPQKSKVMVLGLEYDKMRSDQSLYQEDASNLVALPIDRTVMMANKFLGTDSRSHINGSFALLEKYWYARKIQ
ncbi:MAG: hypothetical protein COU10_01120 [Candidatus Harrisonbacteria bacterium CG10_big_fil_rev_8_21_14_0_10_45_28]|uniref:Uncharacterized protein n=1 Tax=Candidatus Harrisonbacteria bacterium CG10_big_fil_rev_8_21_14_0_10_45_28 TaxID=1974586 RepID=A0A2H0UNT3_9BACT|nr:MAG: hypothetical protein COU10_01120 [Candidatus Harrisonbacteria bacterium CG10_big_fil_rev_8_21_14_0_10_45_28]